VVGKFNDDHLEESKLLSAWSALLTASADKVTQVDWTKGCDAALAVKDAAAIEQVIKAGHLTARVARAAFLKNMERVIEDDEKGVTNASLSAKVLSALDDLPGLGIKVDTENFDFLLQPVVQSGGQYVVNALAKADLKSNDNAFSPDVILFSSSMKYNAHSAFVARTFFVDPSPTQTTLYNTILSAQTALIAELKPGNTIAAACQKALDILTADDTLPQFQVRPNFGCGYGLRATEQHLVLSTSNQTKIEKGMVFAVVMGVFKIPLPDAPKKDTIAMSKIQTYSILLGDTVIVDGGKSGEDDVGATIVTDKIPSERDQVVYELAGESSDEEEEEEEEDEGDKKKKKKGGKSRLGEELDNYDAAAGAGTVGIRSTRLAARRQQDAEDAAAKKKRDEHQKELFERKKEEARKKQSGDGDDDKEDDADAVDKAPDIEAYRTAVDLPRGTRPNQIQVDKSHDAVLLPMFGGLIPFHVSTIKSVIKLEEGTKAILRINFHAPGAAPGKDCPPSMLKALRDYGERGIFIRTLSFQSKDHRNMNNITQVIKAMQKKIKTEREQEQQKAGLVEQPKLILNRDGKVPRLTDLSMWPAISGRKSQGVLEVHTNGIRFMSTKGEKMEVTFSNVRHGIFMPCEGEHVVAIHFHLKHPIIINKKKHKDIQFFTEVVASTEAIDGRKRNDFDADEYNEEERERQIRIEMNKAFRKFAEKVQNAAEGDPTSTWSSFDVPTRDLAFRWVLLAPLVKIFSPLLFFLTSPLPLSLFSLSLSFLVCSCSGTPQREMVTILPGSETLFSIVDKPPFVVSVADIEHVHFERVTFTNRDFDMVIIFKHGTREKGEDEFLRISAIKRDKLDSVKRWLDEVAEVTYTEGANSFNWKQLMEDIVRQPDFWDSVDEEGEVKSAGWKFLADSDDDEEEDSEEESSAYEESSEEESDDEDDEDLSSDFEEESDDESDYEDEDEGSDDDWDELEKKAARDDKKRAREEDEEDAKIRAKYDKNKKKARK
jgi:nucleosome binding factor SPN SPT16 subunit